MGWTYGMALSAEGMKFNKRKISRNKNKKKSRLIGANAFAGMERLVNTRMAMVSLFVLARRRRLGPGHAKVNRGAALSLGHEFVGRSPEDEAQDKPENSDDEREKTRHETHSQRRGVAFR